jgi:hypothetical protein
MDTATVYENIRALSAEFATERRERQQRRELVAADFARLREAGFLLTGAPIDHGGIWEAYRSPRARYATCCARSPMAILQWHWYAPCTRRC